MMAKFQTSVLEVHFYTESLFYIRFERKGFKFKSGQYLVLSFPESAESREYSIASAENSPYLEVLVKEVEGGNFSSKLKSINKGDFIEVEGPFGFFVLREDEILKKEFVFIATGTGISPFQSFVKSISTLNYQLLHGVRNKKDAGNSTYFPPQKYTLCTSRETSGQFKGRVTDFLFQQPIAMDKIYYLCGNAKMINDVSDLLEDAGVPVKNIRSEVFF